MGSLATYMVSLSNIEDNYEENRGVEKNVDCKRDGRNCWIMNVPRLVFLCVNRSWFMLISLCIGKTQTPGIFTEPTWNFEEGEKGKDSREEIKNVGGLIPEQRNCDTLIHCGMVITSSFSFMDFLSLAT